MTTSRAGSEKDTYRVAAIWSDGTHSGWEIAGVTAAQARAAVRDRARECLKDRPRMLLATVCRAGATDAEQVTLPAGGRTVHWAACGQYDVTALDGRIYCIDGQGEPYMDALDGEGEQYVEHERVGPGCGMEERCQAAAAACAAHAGIDGAEHVFDRI